MNSGFKTGDPIMPVPNGAQVILGVLCLSAALAAG